MEYEQDDNSQEGLWDRIKESPRTVSVLIVILIVAAAIYAFSDDQQPAQDVSTDEEVTEETEGVVEGDVMEEGEEVVAPDPVSDEALDEQSQSLPAAEKTDEGFVEVAEAGDGITHLARKATTRYLSENEVGFVLTNEHRIYIEDYVQNRLGSQGLALGEQMTISFTLIDEAVTAAEALTPTQLNNLTQYSGALS